MAPDQELDLPTLAALATLVREHTGIAMNERKRVLLEGRLAPRLRQLGLGSFADYAAVVRRGGAEVQAFINIVTTNDTAFFRTPAVWEYLDGAFLPAWWARQRQLSGTPDAPNACLRIWSAAAASGEEAYSMAMLCQQFQARHAQFRYQIVGTDIDTAMVGACRDGVYGGRSARLLGEQYPAQAAAYFSGAGAGAAVTLTVAPELRRHVTFCQHNLFKPFTGQAPFDLVLLRNVLIYFDEEAQRAVLGQVRRHMALDARLILGEQESVTRLKTPLLFEREHVYRRGADV